MNTSYSADDFASHLELAIRGREHVSGLQISTGLTQEAYKEWLEQHARDYFINSLLSALNWSVHSYYDAEQYCQANMGVEVRLATERTQRLDYLGFDRDTAAPLLVVEAKRPSLSLPIDTTVPSNSRTHPAGGAFAEFLSGIQPERGRNRSVDHLTSDWCKHLTQVKNYALGLNASGHLPARVAITNGRWLVVFCDVKNAFCDGPVDPSQIAVFPKFDPTSQDAVEIRELLDYRKLCRSAASLEPSELPFAINPECILSCLRGIHLIQWTEPQLFQQVPRMTVLPVMFIRSARNTFLRVCRHGDGVHVPSTPEGLAQHLAYVAAEADELKRAVERCLDIEFIETDSIEAHFQDHAAFEKLPAVQRLDHDHSGNGKSFLLVTGTHSHFLRPNPDYEQCPYHEHTNCRSESEAAPNTPIGAPSADLRSFFRDGDRTHCAHRQVLTAKRAEVTKDNELRCGLRSRGHGHAFCELWQFENYLCCRTCVYQDVCTAAEVFSPPCVRLTVEGTGRDDGG